MTQLSDCFAHGGGLMPLDRALALIDSRIGPVTGTESAPLAQCLGRVLAAPVAAGRDVPPHDNSAVDGYAVYFADLAAEGSTALPVAGRAAAGRPFAGAAPRGAAVRVFTGAVMPPGADGGPGPDTVFMQEDCAAGDGRVVLPPGIRRGANRRRAGEDLARGAAALAAGRRLRAEDLGLAASLGLAALPVRVRLRAALFSTGDELRDPGQPLPPGAVYDANRYTLAGLLSGLGCAVSDLGVLPDDPGRVRAALAGAAAGHDLLVSSGGVSVGEEDHVKAAVAALGGLTFWRLAIKPGRPLALGHVAAGGRAAAFVGLPGNPAAAAVTFLRVARPLALRLAGAEAPPPALFPVRAGFARRKKAGRREFVRCRLEDDGGPLPLAREAGRQGAGILSAVSRADGLVELGEELTYVAEGDAAQFLPFAEVR